MAVPTFNNSSAGGLTGLNFANSGMSGLLSSQGNTIEVLVEAPPVKESEFQSPSGNYTGKRRHGLGPRLVTWNCQLKCASDANMNSIEALIEAYLGDGRTFTLTDGKSRSSTFARMASPPLTKRVGRRLSSVPTGSVIQRWQIAFEVLRPVVGSGSAL